MEGHVKKLLKWALLVLILNVAACSPLRTFPECYEIPAVPRIENTAVREWFDGVEPIFVGFGMGTAFAVGLDDQYVYWMTAAHVVDGTKSVKIGRRTGTVIALEQNQDLAIVRTNKSEGWGRVHHFAMTSVGDRAIGVGHSWFYGREVTMIHIGHVVSKDFHGWNGNWRIVTNGGGRGGMSGGPLFSDRRLVIGVASFFADTGVNRQVNPSELCYVPGVVAGLFWNTVHADIEADKRGNSPQQRSF